MDEAEPWPTACSSSTTAARSPRAACGLIAGHIEPQVVEVYDEAGGDLAAFVEAHRALAGRIELSGETAFFCRATPSRCSPPWPAGKPCATSIGPQPGGCVHHQADRAELRD